MSHVWERLCQPYAFEAELKINHDSNRFKHVVIVYLIRLDNLYKDFLLSGMLKENKYADNNVSYKYIRLKLSWIQTSYNDESSLNLIN